MGSFRYAGLSLQVTGAEKFERDLAQANGALRRTEAELKKLTAGYGKGSTDAGYLAQRQQLLTRRLEEEQKKIQVVRQARDAYAREVAAFDPASVPHGAEILEEMRNKLERFDVAVLNAEANEARLERELRETTAALEEQSQAAGQAEDAIQSVGQEADAAKDKAERLAGAMKTLGKAGDGMKKAGDKLSKLVTLPIVGAGTLMLKEAMEFEDAMYTLATMPDVPIEALERYKEAILQASSVTGEAAAGLAEAQYEAISAGVKAEDSVEFVTLAAKAAKAGLTDTKTVVNGATSVLNAWGDAAGGLEHVLDVMAVAQNAGKTTLGELASNIGTVAGIAPQAGMAVEELMAAVAALTANGVGTSEAMTGLRAVLSNIIKPTKQAKEMAKSLGIDFSLAGLQGKGFTGFLREVQEATQGDADKLAELFGSVQGLSQIMALGGSAGELYAQVLRDMGDAAGTVDRAFSSRTASKMQQMQLAMNKLKNAGMGLAENLSPGVEAVSEMVSGLAEWAGGLDKAQQKTLIAGLGMAAGLGPVLKVTGTMVSGISKLPAILAKVAPLLSGPWGLTALLAAGVGAVAVAAATAESSMDRLDRRLESIDLHVSPESAERITEAINAGMEAARRIHQIQVEAEVDTAAITEKIDTAFDNGKMDRKEYTGITKWITEVIGGDIDSALKVIEEKKTELGESAAAPMAEVAEQLEASKKDLETLLKGVYRRGGTATEEELERMKALLQQIQAYRTELGLLQDDAVKNAQDAYTRQTMGFGNETTLGTAMGYVGEMWAQERTRIARTRADYETEMNAAFAAAEGDQQRLAELVRANEAQMDAFSQEEAAADQEKLNGLMAIYEGIGKQNQAGAEAIQEVGRLAGVLDGLMRLGGDVQDKVAAVRKLLQMPGNEGLLDGDIAWAQLSRPGYTPGGMEDEQSMDVLLQGLQTRIADKMQELMGAEGVSPLTTALQAMMDDASLGELDVTRFSGLMADAMRASILSREGVEGLGSEVMRSIGSAITESADQAADPAAEAAERVNAALSSAVVDTDTWAAQVGGIGDAIRSAGAGAIAQAVALRTSLMGILGGMSLQLPGAGVGESSGGGLVPGARVYNQTTNLHFGNMNISDRATGDAIMHQINNIGRMSRAGVGVME